VTPGGYSDLYDMLRRTLAVNEHCGKHLGNSRDKFNGTGGYMKPHLNTSGIEIRTPKPSDHLPQVAAPSPPRGWSGVDVTVAALECTLYFPVGTSTHTRTDTVLSYSRRHTPDDLEGHDDKDIGLPPHSANPRHAAKMGGYLGYL
jgi:hypothetical protein